MVGKSIRHQVAGCRAAAEQFAAPKKLVDVDGVNKDPGSQFYSDGGSLAQKIENKTPNFYVCIN